MKPWTSHQGRLWIFPILFLCLAFINFSQDSPRVWAQGGTYKAPMPKPGAAPPPPKPAEKAEVKAQTPAGPSAPSPEQIVIKPSSPPGEVDVEFEIKRLNNLLKLNEANADAYFNRACLYEYVGDLSMAEIDYTKAIEKDPKHKDARYNRGLLFVRAKKFAEAIKDFSEVIKLDPRSVDALCNRGNAQYHSGQKDLALVDYEAALKFLPQDGDLYYNRGMVLLAKGEKTKALEDLNKAAQGGHAKAKEYLERSKAK